MNKKDVLVNDIRVTALAPDGPYNFEWVDDETIKLTDDCEYTSVPSNVANAIREHNLKIIDDDLKSNTKNNKNNNKNNNLLTTPSSSNTSNSNNNYDESKESNNDDAEHISFIVRMEDPSERQDVIEKLKKFNVEASKKLQLSGPYKVIYEVKEDSLELVGMKDMGIGSEHGFTDI